MNIHFFNLLENHLNVVQKCSALIYNPCPDLKSFLPWFVIFDPIWNLFAPIWNPFPDLYFFCPNLKSLKMPRFLILLLPRFVTQKVFSHFFSILVLVFKQITFDFVVQIWWNLVWDTFYMIPKNEVGFNEFKPSHWWHNQSFSTVLVLKFEHK